jgi:hypothetical protein
MPFVFSVLRVDVLLLCQDFFPFVSFLVTVVLKNSYNSIPFFFVQRSQSGISAVGLRNLVVSTIVSGSNSLGSNPWSAAARAHHLFGLRP